MRVIRWAPSPRLGGVEEAGRSGEDEIGRRRGCFYNDMDNY
jgi:hypothetical protein